MYRLSTAAVLKLWEQYAAQPPLERALAILAAALPKLSYSELAELSIGQRNRHLMELRQAHFGKQLQCLVDCSHCHDSLEFSMDISQLHQGAAEVIQLQTMALADYLLTFRPLNSYDLAAAAQYTELVQAQQQLVQCCLVEVKYQGQSQTDIELPASVVEALAQEIKLCDPLAELMIPINCPSCQQRSEVLFDIAAFVWEELMTELKQVLHEVHELASVYGWSEADILAMSTTHRQFYLQKVRA